MATTKINITIVSAVFACAILIGAVNVMSAQAKVNYDAGEKYKGFTYNHDKASLNKALKAADNKEQEECLKKRAELSNELSGYEAVKCLKDPKNSY